jgi:hypothetical protein
MIESRGRRGGLMKQLTVRGFDKELDRRIRKLARERGISLNKAALLLLRRGAGLRGAEEPAADVVGDSLAALFGTWSEEEGEEFESAIEELEQVDEGLWR